MFSIGSRIRRVRSMANLSQSQLAEQVGVKRSAVAQWERDPGTFPSVKNLVKIAVIADVKFEWLATGRGSPQAQPHEFDTVATLSDFAQNEDESRALELLRRLSPKKRHAVCAILEALCL
ncbi:helix-turn-helix domain-containing protein [Xanthomonas bundabergensis]|uniref:helix-turn-helix domain-containing protein n=1 Tax=Xanthomonas bundabergensis TaxID=3160842 RepID=UPI00351188C3